MTSEAVIDTLKKACADRKVCKVHMKDEPGDRLINPHGVCYSSKNKLIIVSIQVKGHSESKNPSHYRNLPLHDCESVEILTRTFTIDKDFNPEDKQYKTWLFHVMMK
jgi:hypothetical protein